MESQKTKGGEYNFGGLRWYLFNTYWRFTLLSVQRQQSRGTGGLKLLLQDTLQHTSSFVSCPKPVCITMYECSKSNGNIVVKTKKTCYFTLDRVWNIHEKTTENSISRFLDFNIFWGSNLPQETPRGSRLWRSQYFPLLRNIRISTNTPSQTPATRLIMEYWFINKWAN